MTYKYIRFKLPSSPTSDCGTDRLSSNMTKIAVKWITEQLYDWSAEHRVEYVLHLRDDAVYVEFERASAVSELMLTWKPRAHSTGWTRISVTETMDYKCYEPYVLSEEVGYLEDMLASDLVTSTVDSTVKP